MEKGWITLVVIFGILGLGGIILTLENNSSITKETTECIAENSILYIQLGCHACEAQEEMFGDNYQYLNVVDCFFEGEKCPNIRGTPTWIIQGEEYLGIQNIETLKTLTGCK